jgi:hypothetical protein
MNADFSYDKNSNNVVNDKFIKLINKKLFGGNKSLIDFYNERYNTIVFGDLKFENNSNNRSKTNISSFFKKSNTLVNINLHKPILPVKNKTMSSIKNFKISTNNKKSQILSILPNIKSEKIYQTYDYPDKSGKKMTSLTFSLYEIKSNSGTIFGHNYHKLSEILSPGRPLMSEQNREEMNSQRRDSVNNFWRKFRKEDFVSQSMNESPSAAQGMPVSTRNFNANKESREFMERERNRQFIKRNH